MLSLMPLFAELKFCASIFVNPNAKSRFRSEFNNIFEQLALLAYIYIGGEVEEMVSVGRLEVQGPAAVSPILCADKKYLNEEQTIKTMLLFVNSNH